MKCTACGADLVDGAKFCEYCGTPVVAAAPAPAPAPAPAQEQSYNYQQPQNQAPQPVRAQAQYVQPQQAQPAAADPQANKLNVWSLILGISAMGGAFSFVWVAFLGLVAVGIAIAGLVVSGKARKLSPTNKMARTGHTLSLIGLIIAAILTIIMTIVWLVALGHSRYYYY